MGKRIVDARLVIYLKDAGDFGSVRIGGMTRSDSQWTSLAVWSMP